MPYQWLSTCVWSTCTEVEDLFSTVSLPNQRSQCCNPMTPCCLLPRSSSHCRSSPQGIAERIAWKVGKISILFPLRPGRQACWWSWLHGCQPACLRQVWLCCQVMPELTIWGGQGVTSSRCQSLSHTRAQLRHLRISPWNHLQPGVHSCGRYREHSLLVLADLPETSTVFSTNKVVMWNVYLFHIVDKC